MPPAARSAISAWICCLAARRLPRVGSSAISARGCAGEPLREQHLLLVAARQAADPRGACSARGRRAVSAQRVGLARAPGVAAGPPRRSRSAAAWRASRCPGSSGSSAGPASLRLSGTMAMPCGGRRRAGADPDRARRRAGPRRRRGGRRRTARARPRCGRSRPGRRGRRSRRPGPRSDTSSTAPARGSPRACSTTGASGGGCRGGGTELDGGGRPSPSPASPASPRAAGPVRTSAAVAQHGDRVARRRAPPRGNAIRSTIAVPPPPASRRISPQAARSRRRQRRRSARPSGSGPSVARDRAQDLDLLLVGGPQRADAARRGSSPKPGPLLAASA